MKATCFYADVPYHALLSDGQSIGDAPRGLDASEREVIAGYLEGGVVFDQCPGLGVDALDSSKTTSLDTATDGEWVWPVDAAHYCREYGIGPHPDFVAKVRSLNGVPPVPTADQMSAILTDFFSGMVFDDESIFASPGNDENDEEP